KILATLPMVMKLYENKDISFDTKLGELLPELKNSNKKNITTLEILSHYGKLKPWIPFYLATLNPDKTPSDKYYRKAAEGKFNVKIANDLYMREDYKDTMYQLIADSPLQPKLEYKYSDLPFLIMKKYIEKEYGKHLEDLDQKYFYEGLGANYTTFRPLEKFPLSQITPTENDNYFRHQIIRGYVHDMGAAMLNGVGGHAGLFSNANDVAKIMQMYLQNGYYGGQQFLETSTMGVFNTCHYCNKNNRRGIGFDKPQLGSEGPTCGCVSMKSFGHSGFTGTFAWADPEAEIVYIFMSNRTFPDSSINKLSKESIRERIQQIIYDAIFE
ncbi:MAG: beta-N-acetylglucosaminidase, partial [Bacteroidetes bacterium HGW-Bacteroidetes-13]